MAGQAITADLVPSLEEWFEYNLSTGCSPEQLRQTLVDSGYRAADVDGFLRTQASGREARSGLYDAEPVASPDAAIERFWQRSDVLMAFNQIALGDRTAPILARSPPHGLYFIPGFLSDAECDWLIREGGGRLTQSRVLDEGRGEHLKTLSRSSRGAMIPRGSHDMARRIESRLAKLTALPVSHGEDLQILNYPVGGEYRPHFDYFDPATKGGAKMLSGRSQRLATVILYLNDVETGGGTRFPQLSLEFTPMRGAALLFPSIGRDGVLLETSLHAGAPVASGEKWIATKWIRVQPHPSQGGV